MINTKTQISTIKLTFAPLMLQWVLVIVNLFWMPFLTENLWERTCLISEDFNHHIRSPSHSHHGLDAVLPLVSSEPPDHNCKNVDRLKGRPYSELWLSALNCFVKWLHCIVWALCPWLEIFTDTSLWCLFHSHVLVCLFCTSFFWFFFLASPFLIFLIFSLVPPFNFSMIFYFFLAPPASVVQPPSLPRLVSFHSSKDQPFGEGSLL